MSPRRPLLDTPSEPKWPSPEWVQVATKSVCCDQELCLGEARAQATCYSNSYWDLFYFLRVVPGHRKGTFSS